MNPIRFPELTITPPNASTPAQPYDAVAEDYDRLIRPRYERIAALVRDRLLQMVESPTCDVVELSAGTGALTHQLAPLIAGRYVATDISGPMLAVGRRRGGSGTERVAWVRSDVRQMILDDQVADAVVSALGPFQDTDLGVLEARRLLRPAGILVACAWGDRYRELDLLQDARARLGLPPRPVTSAPALRKRLWRADFRDVEVHEVRLTVVHDSVDAYVAYRQAFGPVPGLSSTDNARVIDAIAECASRYCDRHGRVALDWQLLLLSGRV